MGLTVCQQQMQTLPINISGAVSPNAWLIQILVPDKVPGSAKVLHGEKQIEI
ncbi:MAG: hypothetical protein CM1200mP13_16430 [Candidatus Pelagibacterales bacterium]|nr:MAG: hypothetical protein CM1200mP13_16430 [Pelagibacterales bacterium]